MSEFLHSLPFIFFIGFAVFVFYSAFSKRGKGWMFGGEIIYTSPQNIVKRYTIQTRTIVVHSLMSFKSPHEKMVGLEVRHTAIHGFSVVPIALSIAEAEQLVEMLQDVLEKKVDYAQVPSHLWDEN